MIRLRVKALKVISGIPTGKTWYTVLLRIKLSNLTPRYEPWMAQEFSMNVKWGADCIGVKEVNRLGNQWCHRYAYDDAVCDESCLV